MKTVHDRKAKAEATAARWERSADRHSAAAKRAREKGQHEKAAKHEALQSRSFRLLTKAKRTIARFAPLAAMAKEAERIAEAVQGTTSRLNRERLLEDKEARRKLRLGVARHGGNDRIEIGSKLVVDPYEPDKTLRVSVNLRESPLETLKARRRINDAEYEAGRWFRGVYERASIGPLTAIDPTKEAVDGGRFAEPLSDATMRAAQELRGTVSVVGAQGYLLLSAIVGQGKTIDEVASVWGRTVIQVTDGQQRRQKSAVAIVTTRLIEALRDIATHNGATGPRRGLMRAARELGLYSEGPA
ncbi:hypothetical protein ACFQU1_20370 [Chelatococcus sp. GCM10030263]|uniref:hypothetical protein n=1 Tax=Chelatococcus sp. GCM10030263 TaxID=3273387 RepID=UPI003609227E